MGHELPDIPPDELRRQLAGAGPEPLEATAVEALAQHYAELKRWNPRLSLIGPGSVQEILTRHYGESLAALPLLQPDDKVLLDIGSGAGFPGLVLAAARPGLHCVLTEARQKKWAFLTTAAQRSGLSCTCLNARVEVPLPAGIPSRIDVVTSRAVKIPPELLERLISHSPEVRILLWRGEAEPEIPVGLGVRRQLHLPGSRVRRIVEVARSTC